MSRYSERPLEFSGLNTVSLEQRGGKVRVEHFAKPYGGGGGLNAWLDSLPDLLAAADLRRIAEALERARRQGRRILWGLGGHVIKCGLAPVLADLMDRGWATGFAMNGAAAIHDLEIGLCGATSEDVEAVLPDGRFGVADETGRQIARACEEAAAQSIGFGEALGQRLNQSAGMGFRPHSLLLRAWEARVPVTVHVAIGTDTPHTHPALRPEALGSASHADFRLFCSLVGGLNGGGVYLNTGSAVVLPEVFLKAVSVVRNLGHPLADFTTVNLDFLQHYRPRVNVVERPHAGAGGRGYAVTGHHELLLPLLAAVLIDREQ